MGGSGCVGSGLMLLLSRGLKVWGDCRSSNRILVSEVDRRSGRVGAIGGGVVRRRSQSVSALDGGEGRCQGVS